MLTEGTRHAPFTILHSSTQPFPHILLHTTSLEPTCTILLPRPDLLAHGPWNTVGFLLITTIVPTVSSSANALQKYAQFATQTLPFCLCGQQPLEQKRNRRRTGMWDCFHSKPNSSRRHIRHIRSATAVHPLLPHSASMAHSSIFS